MKLQMPISEDELHRLYALSQGVVINEQQSTSEYFNMDYDQFIEFIYRVAQNVYNPASHNIAMPEQPLSGKKAKQPDYGDLKKEVYSLFEADEYTKFKELLKLVIMNCCEPIQSP